MASALQRPWPAAFQSLRHRDFRFLWLGLSFSAMGTWMQIIGQSLLVLKISHNSPVALGWVSLAQALAFFAFALLGGSIADRIDRRRLLLLTQSLLLVMALLLGVLTTTGTVHVWMVVVIAFLSGTLLSFDQPARASLIASLVPPEDLLNAVSLQSAVFNGAATIGPALAGVVTYSLGLSVNFYLNAASFLGVLFALSVINVQKHNRAANRAKLLLNILEALNTVKRDSVLPSLLCSYAVLLFFGPSLQLLLPILDNEVLHAGPRTLGLLFSASGMGAILGALCLTTLSRASGTITVVRSAFPLWALSLITAGFSSRVAITFTALICFGFAQSMVGAITLTSLQTRGPVEQRGRAASLNTLLMMGIRPLGDFPAAAAIALFGAPATACAGALVVAAVSGAALRHLNEVAQQ